MKATHPRICAHHKLGVLEVGGEGGRTQSWVQKEKRVDLTGARELIQSKYGANSQRTNKKKENKRTNK